MKSFNSCEIQELEILFGLKKVKNHHLLTDWINTQVPINKEITDLLIILKNELADNVDFWNEEDLKMYFISRLLREAFPIQPRYRMFFQCSISAKIGDIQLGGVADMLIATGYQRPIQPYFFIHEYKPERKFAGDPLGQLIAEMLVAQSLNKNSDLPIYGIYVVGRNWFFVILSQKEYSVSDAFVATQDDIFQIFSALKTAKTYIDGFIK